MKKSSQKLILYILIAALLLIIILLFQNAYSHYSQFKSHENFFRQPHPAIEPGMTFVQISRQFNLGGGEILNQTSVPKVVINPHLTLERFCIQYNQNCTLLVEKLNRLVRK